MSDLLPPNATPWPKGTDLANTLADILQTETWPSLWPRMTHVYATTAARDAELSGLGSADRAFAYVKALERITIWKGSSWYDPGVPVMYSSVTGAAPIATVGNVAGTVLQTLVIPTAPFARTLSVNALAYLVSTQTADSWETVVTYDSNDITVNVLGRFTMTLNSASSAGSGVVPAARLGLNANVGTTLRVWVRRVAGTGTGTGSTDHTYCKISALAIPV